MRVALGGCFTWGECTTQQLLSKIITYITVLTVPTPNVLAPDLFGAGVFH